MDRFLSVGFVRPGGVACGRDAAPTGPRQRDACHDQVGQGHAHCRQRQRAGQMGARGSELPADLATGEQIDRLRQEGGKGREPPQKAGDNEEPQLRRQSRMTAKPGRGQADQQAAREICGQGAERQGRKDGG